MKVPPGTPSMSSGMTVAGAGGSAEDDAGDDAAARGLEAEGAMGWAVRLAWAADGGRGGEGLAAGWLAASCGRDVSVHAARLPSRTTRAGRRMADVYDPALMRGKFLVPPGRGEACTNGCRIDLRGHWRGGLPVRGLVWWRWSVRCP